MTQENDSIRAKQIAAVVDALVAEGFGGLQFPYDATPEEIVRILQKADNRLIGEKIAETRGG